MKKGCVHAVLPTHLVTEILQEHLRRQRDRANLNQTQKFDFLSSERWNALKLDFLWWRRNPPFTNKHIQMCHARAYVCARVCVSITPSAPFKRKREGATDGPFFSLMSGGRSCHRRDCVKYIFIFYFFWNHKITVMLKICGFLRRDRQS